MGTMNRVFLMGNLTRDPQLRKTPTGMAVADLGLAVTDKYRRKDGEIAETVCFVDIVVWGKSAENCAQYLSKGSMALVEGRLQFDTWQTDQGEKRHKLKVQADRVQFMTFKKAATSERDTDDRDAVPAEVGAAAGGTDSAPAPF